MITKKWGDKDGNLIRTSGKTTKMDLTKGRTGLSTKVEMGTVPKGGPFFGSASDIRRESGSV
jgi:hypothetical protein